MSAIDCARAILNYISDYDAAVTMVAIAGAESGWRADARGDYGYTDRPNCGGYTSFGAWQYNLIHESYLRNQTGSSDPCAWAEWLMDLDNNAKAAADLYAGQGFIPWTVYRTGAYRQYLDEARAAVDEALSQPQPQPTPQPTPTPAPPAETIPAAPLGLLGAAAIAGLLGLGGAGAVVLAKKEGAPASGEYGWMLVAGGILIVAAGAGYFVWRRALPIAPGPPWKVSSNAYGGYADLAIAWATSPKAEYYEVQHAQDNAIVYRGSYTYTTIYGLAADSPYTVRVRACSWAGCSPWSDWSTLYT